MTEEDEKDQHDKSTGLTAWTSIMKTQDRVHQHGDNRDKKYDHLNAILPNARSRIQQKRRSRARLPLA